MHATTEWYDEHTGSWWWLQPPAAETEARGRIG